jgi:hypothetical protein
MPKYRKKPVVIEAVRLEGDDTFSLNKIVEFVGADRWMVDVMPNPPAPELLIETIEGTMRCRVGDWLIRGVKGELYPCKPDIFEATYEAVA